MYIFFAFFLTVSGNIQFATAITDTLPNCEQLRAAHSAIPKDQLEVIVGEPVMHRQSTCVKVDNVPSEGRTV